MSQTPRPKIGLEIHQQLDTATKLFCQCSTEPGDKREKELERRLRPVASELGEIDPASRYEHARQKSFRYQYYTTSCCLVEADEEPPHPLNRQALEIALTTAGLLECDIPDEIHVMRKIVIDGSSVSGFQRTCKIGSEGRLRLENSEIGISDLELEEDAAKIVDRGQQVVYDLSRSGVPLIEIGTEPDIKSAEEAKEAALKLGSILRSTRQVKRGIGTIRQDVNVSIPEGARVEIKGFQDVKNIDHLIEKEVERQQSLVELKEKLQDRDEDICQVKAKRDDPAQALFYLPDLLQQLKEDIGDKTLYDELKPYVTAYGADLELITPQDMKQGSHDWEEVANSELAANDCLLLIKYTGEQEGAEKMEGRDLTVTKLNKALKSLKERINLLAVEVPEETRVANEDHTSSYSRPLPGEARLYPETDIPPFALSSDYLQTIRDNLPETFDAKRKRFAEEIGQELAGQIIKSDYLDLYEEFTDQFDLEPKFIANLLTNTIKDLETRKGIDLSSLDEEDYSHILQLVEKEEIPRDSVTLILEKKVEQPEQSVEAIVESEGLEKTDEGEIEAVIDDLIADRQEMIEEQGMHAKKALMGEVMGKFRGKADGARVNRLLQEKLEKLVDDD